jgi:hypothetical protein
VVGIVLFFKKKISSRLKKSDKELVLHLRKWIPIAFSDKDWYHDEAYEYGISDDGE